MALRFPAFPLFVIAIATSAPAQVEFAEDNSSATILNQPVMLGPAASLQDAAAAAATGLPFFTAGLTSFDRSLPITFVGGDPRLPGSGTTTVPTLIVPLLVNFLDGSGSLDATDIVLNTVQSPLFTPVDFSAGGTDLGITQYGDAVQRAEFWSYTNPGGISPAYHVLLGQPTVLPTITINVPPQSGSIVHTRIGNIPLGRVNDAFWEPAIVNILKAIGATPNEMPIFLSKNIGLYVRTPSNCCILGYHNSTSGAAAMAQTWIWASWLSSGIFSTFQDVLGLSHEISEWLNDPFVGALFLQVPGINWVAPYQLPGQGGACQPNFETGDAVEALPNGGFSVPAANGFTYHLQDAAFVWWFLHTVPSPAVNGQYTLQNIFSTPASLCNPG